MTHTTQVLSDELPPMPSPVIRLPWRHNDVDGSILTVAFSERQMREYALLAIESAPLAALGGQPVAWMWQHDETGRTGFVEANQLAMGWQSANPRLQIVAPCYTHAQPAPVDKREAAKVSLCVLCAVLDANEWHPNMRKDIQFAIDANRAALQCAQAPQPTKGQP
jgi:hypothetical protein